MGSVDSMVELYQTGNVLQAKEEVRTPKPGGTIMLSKHLL